MCLRPGINSSLCSKVVELAGKRPSGDESSFEGRNAELIACNAMADSGSAAISYCISRNDGDSHLQFDLVDYGVSIDYNQFLAIN